MHHGWCNIILTITFKTVVINYVFIYLDYYYGGDFAVKKSMSYFLVTTIRVSA